MKTYSAISQSAGSAFVSVPIDARIYNELLIRHFKVDTNVAAWIQEIVQDYLDRTADEGYWSEQYHEWRASTTDLDAFVDKFGDPSGGYHWSSLFLPNGTKVSMSYKGKTYNAEVRHAQIWYEGKSYSPAELARVIASNTSRNAWRDLMIRRPNDQEWQLADVLRRK